MSTDRLEAITYDDAKAAILLAWTNTLRDTPPEHLTLIGSPVITWATFEGGPPAVRGRRVLLLL